MANPRLCSIPDCGKSHYARNFCIVHYSRMKRHGDPLAGRTRQGEPLEYIESVVLNFEGDNCLTWPFHRSPRFYGMVVVDGRRQVATRYICTLVNGNPPTAKHYAAHECGKGHEGCVNPRHLSWKTPSENEADRLVHGTDCSGEKSHNAKLSDTKVKIIRDLAGQLPMTEMARMFGVAPFTISRVIARQTWKHIE